MCVEDWNIPQSFQTQRYDVNATAVGTFLVLPVNLARAGFIIGGPNTGDVRVRLVENSGLTTFGSVGVTDLAPGKIYLVRDYGPILQKEIHFNSSVAQQFVVFEYLWVINPKQRAELAKTGGF